MCNLINELLLENKDNSDIYDILLNIIDENIELIYDTEEKREKLFLLLNSMNKSSIFLNK